MFSVIIHTLYPISDSSYILISGTVPTFHLFSDSSNLSSSPWYFLPYNNQKPFLPFLWSSQWQFLPLVFSVAVPTSGPLYMAVPISGPLYMAVPISGPTVSVAVLTSLNPQPAGAQISLGSLVQPVTGEYFFTAFFTTLHSFLKAMQPLFSSHFNNYRQK